MKIKLAITRHTTASELIILGAFFESLSLAREGHVSSVSADEPLTAPTDPAELQEPETVTVQADAPKRRRRTKAEIEAAAAAEVEKIIDKGEHLQEPEPAAPEEVPVQEGPIEPGATGNDHPAPTPPVQQPATPTSETASTTPASASPSEPTGPITHAYAQKQAIDAARRFGPEKVKAIIAEYEGAAKIADLKEADLASFIGKLQALAA